MEKKYNKVIGIGDTHGRELWKDIVSKEKDADKIIFIGDYFDTHYDISVDQQIENFKEILDFKKNNMDQVILLLGNHDFHYLKNVTETYSGYQQFKRIDINEVLQPAVDNGLIQMCYVYDRFVFTHAGVTKTWCQDNEIDVNNLQDSINKKFLENVYSFYFTYGDNMSRSGDDITQTPIWVRIPSLLKDGLDDKTFVVGHTTLEKLTITDKIIGIDTVGTTGEYLVIENLQPRAEIV
jgi:hypothetical protein